MAFSLIYLRISMTFTPLELLSYVVNVLKVLVLCSLRWVGNDKNVHFQSENSILEKKFLELTFGLEFDS